MSSNAQNKSKTEVVPAATEERDTPHFDLPLDLSFRALITASEIPDEIDYNFDGYKKLAKGSKFLTNVVRLNNNTLNDITGLDAVLQDILFCPEDLAWLDLSFNQLTTIDPVITKFKNLRMIYLHGNQIPKIEEIEKLKTLPHLIKITLHGNPIEGEKNYRQHILTALPKLKTLDFSGVTKSDRFKAEVYHVATRKTRRNRGTRGFNTRG